MSKWLAKPYTEGTTAFVAEINLLTVTILTLAYLITRHWIFYIKKNNMNFIGNIIWIIFGGLFIFFEYLIGGLILCLTIIGIPFGIQCIKFAFVGLAPFGVKITETSSNTGCLSFIMNIIWLLCGGIWIALTHLFFGILLCITVVGIPFGRQHFKLMNLAFSPFGKSIS